MPATVHLVIGGCRSGKSSYAQSLCEGLCPQNPIYLATSKFWDGDFADRVRRHKNDRGERWTTIEEPLRPSRHGDAFGGRAVLVDCLTLWLTNHFVECGVFNEPDDGENNDAKEASSSTDEDVASASERALSNAKAEFDALISRWDATFVFVTNEIGSGLHAPTSASRKFVDAQGWFNQYVASNADTVVHMVAGVPNFVKRPSSSAVAGARDPLKAPCDRDLEERAMLDKFLSARKLNMDEKGYFMMKVDHERGVIRATYHSCIKNENGEICDVQGRKISCSRDNRPEPMIAFEARTAKELTVEVFERWEHAGDLVSLGHAAYVGREAQRAEACLFAGRFYQQD
jgi:adenosylcobinamide kinase/adenosylcobinamide-phosphate guanylyltransferase